LFAIGWHLEQIGAVGGHAFSYGDARGDRNGHRKRNSVDGEPIGRWDRTIELTAHFPSLHTYHSSGAGSNVSLVLYIVRVRETQDEGVEWCIPDPVRRPLSLFA
jgi:hypothetical protein